MESVVRIFSGTSSEYLAKEIAQSYGVGLGTLKVQRFADGEISPVILESVRGDYVFFIQSTFAPAENILELLLL
ncbi:MAG: ribose-phosphate pyrophosphokinase-like domain-containing protein, partial [Bacteroidota bacterium]